MAIIKDPILKEKLKRIMGGKPWKLWRFLRERGFQLKRNEKDFSQYASDLKKVSQSTTSSSATEKESLENVSNHALINAINNLNAKMFKYVSNEHTYALEMLNLSLRAECYDRALGLADYLLHYWNDMSIEQQEFVFNRIIPIYFAFGKKEELKELIYHKATDLPMNDTLSTCIEVLFLDNDSTLVNGSLLLPSGKLNILKFVTSIQNNSISELEFVQFINKYAHEFKNKPQLYGAIWNYFVHNGRKDEALYYLNKLFSSYSIPLMTDYKKGNNILNDILFEKKEEIKDGPLVSVIIAAYNAETNLDYVLRSMVNQTYQNIEILICDDLSTDTTLEVLKDLQKKYASSNIKLYQSRQNQGPYNIRNALIEVAEGDLITFQDADDFSLPSRIEMQVQAMAASNAIACIGKWIRIRPNGEIVYFQDQLSLRMSVVSLMAPKYIFLENGPYHTVKFGADTHFYEKLRARYGDKKISNLEIPLLLGLWSNDSLTRTNGIEALEDGYRGEARRDYAKLAFEKRYYGNEVYHKNMLEEKLKEISVYRENHGIVPIT